MSASARSWIGIGAQRCGTTWFTDLLLQHPRLGLAGDRKELHAFDPALVEAWDRTDATRYRSAFEARPGVALGEFTPSYLRCLWIPRLLADSAPSDAVFLVLLRDPVARFESAIRWYLGRQHAPGPGKPAAMATFLRTHGSDATWGGMYAPQLDAFADGLGKDRILVLQYETLARDPQTTLEMVWQRLGLTVVQLTETQAPSRTSTTGGFSIPDHLRDRLATLYRPQCRDLADRWGIDLSLWEHSFD